MQRSRGRVRGRGRGRGAAGAKRKTLEKTSNMETKGSLSSLLTEQLPLQDSSNSTRFQKLLDAQDPSSSLPPLDAIDEHMDFILSQDFFCTPDYITPDGQHISNNLEFNKENIACPKSPEKSKNTAISKRRRQGFFPSVGGDGLSRYRTDFHEIEQIGFGNFSRVFKVLKRIDGCMYAVKHSIRQLHHDMDRRRALMEVQALAALGSHENIVGYYTSWFENEQLYIQMELCDHSLSINKYSQLSTEGEVLEAMYQIARGLKFIHERGVAHLDVKPDNIYVKHGVYKLGDFGCARLINGSLPIEEGDARYMPLEILNDKFEHLDKVDIFSLGVAIYELLKGSPLPESGPQFMNLREGKISLLPGHSMQLQNLLKVMLDPDPVRRPTAQQLVENLSCERARRCARAK